MGEVTKGLVARCEPFASLVGANKMEVGGARKRRHW